MFFIIATCIILQYSAPYRIFQWQENIGTLETCDVKGSALVACWCLTVNSKHRAYRCNRLRHGGKHIIRQTDVLIVFEEGSTSANAFFPVLWSHFFFFFFFCTEAFLSGDLNRLDFSHWCLWCAFTMLRQRLEPREHETGSRIKHNMEVLTFGKPLALS